MATSYLSPGVYVEEITKLPPSVAPVETAIPAFIGYTQKADDAAPNDLSLKPTRISSMVEYEKYFGAPQPEDNIKVTITQTTQPDTSVDEKISANFRSFAHRASQTELAQRHSS